MTKGPVVQELVLPLDVSALAPHTQFLVCGQQSIASGAATVCFPVIPAGMVCSVVIQGWPRCLQQKKLPLLAVAQ